jgi:hypothetical protein
VDLHVEVAQVVVVWDCLDTWDSRILLVFLLGKWMTLETYGSAMRRSVSLIIRLGRPAMVAGV